MHSLAPYSIRCFHPEIVGNSKDKFRPLGKIGNHDLYDLMEDFIRLKESDFHVLDERKEVYRFSGFKFEPKNRVLCGWFQVGKFGFKSDIINVETQKVDFEKTTKNAEIINHFLYFSIPKDCDEGVALLHMFQGNAVKTIFFDLFRSYVFDITGFRFQMNPLSYEKALDKWRDANAKEIRLIKFKGYKDKADTLKGLGHNEQTLTLKPGRGKVFGQLKDFMNKFSKHAKTVELLDSECEKIATVVELNGKKRTFSIGKNNNNTISEVEAPETLECESGIPKFNSIKKWCKEICDEFSQSMHKK